MIKPKTHYLSGEKRIRYPALTDRQRFALVAVQDGCVKRNRRIVRLRGEHFDVAEWRTACGVDVTIQIRSLKKRRLVLHTKDGPKINPAAL